MIFSWEVKGPIDWASSPTSTGINKWICSKTNQSVICKQHFEISVPPPPPNPIKLAWSLTGPNSIYTSHKVWYSWLQQDWTMSREESPSNHTSAINSLDGLRQAVVPQLPSHYAVFGDNNIGLFECWAGGNCGVMSSNLIQLWTQKVV